MTAKIRIEYVRLANPGDAVGDAQVVEEVLGGGEAILVTGVGAQTTVAPAFPPARGLLGGVHARIRCELGAVVVSEPGLNPAVDQATGVRIEQGDPPICMPIATGQRLALVEGAVADNIVASQLVIATGQSLSAAIDLGLQRLHRIRMPAAWSAAAVSFQDSDDGVTYGDTFGETAEYAITSAQAAAGRTILVDQELFYGIRFLKVRSGVTAAPVAQAADRTLTLITVPR